MITLSAAAKAGAVCLSLTSQSALFCTMPARPRQVLFCTSDCRTAAELRRLYLRHPERQIADQESLYGVPPGTWSRVLVSKSHQAKWKKRP